MIKYDNIFEINGIIFYILCTMVTPDSLHTSAYPDAQTIDREACLALTANAAGSSSLGGEIWDLLAAATEEQWQHVIVDNRLYTGRLSSALRDTLTTQTQCNTHTLTLPARMQTRRRLFGLVLLEDEAGAGHVDLPEPTLQRYDEYPDRVIAYGQQLGIRFSPHQKSMAHSIVHNIAYEATYSADRAFGQLTSAVENLTDHQQMFSRRLPAVLYYAARKYHRAIDQKKASP